MSDEPKTDPTTNGEPTPVAVTPAPIEPNEEAVAAKKAEKSKIALWLGNFVLGGALIMVVAVLLMATLARFDVVDKLTGFGPFYLAKNPAWALLAIGLVGLVIAFMRKSRGVWKLVVGSLLSAGMLFALYTMLIWPAGEVPPIHDISTDLDDMPQFTTLDVEPVSLGSMSEEEWRAFHEEAYGSLGPIVIDKPPVEVLADAQALAEDRGWEIAAFDAASGTLEATATAGYVRFYDDVIVEVTPVQDGSTRVDMRSVSRVGQSDVGYNAARIEAFLADLRAMN